MGALLSQNLKVKTQKCVMEGFSSLERAFSVANGRLGVFIRLYVVS
jgi:hypothetical protein